MGRRRVDKAVAAVVLFLLPAAVARGQVDRASLFEATEKAIEEARADQAELLAPRLFQQARSKLGEAQRAFDRGKNLADIRKILDEAAQAARRAREVALMGQRAFDTLLPAREAALKAQAPQLAPQLYQEGERRLAEAVAQLERGDVEGAKRRGSIAEKAFRDAELVAIKASILTNARELYTQATAQKCDRLTPSTYATASSFLAEAEKLLDTDRYATERAKELAARAEWHFLQALILAKEIEQGLRSASAIEGAILSREDQLRRVARELGIGVTPGQPPEAIGEAILTQIGTLRAENERLQNSLIERERSLAELRAKIQEIESRHASLEQQLAEQKRMLEAQRLREAKIRKITSLFEPQEAEVVTIGDRLVIRLYGLAFPVGKAIIEPKYFELLSKVQTAIREFPEARVAVEGHTDSQGDDTANQKLSFERANAVRQYLLANMGISEDRIIAVGHGESRPIASNDSPEGRAKNRRIEIILQMQ